MFQQKILNGLKDQGVLSNFSQLDLSLKTQIFFYLQNVKTGLESESGLFGD